MQVCKTFVTNGINSKLSVDDSDALEYNSNGYNSPSTSQSVKMLSPESRHVLQRVFNVSPIKELAVDDSKKSTMKCTQKIDLFGEPVPPSTCVKKLEPETKCVKKTPRKTPVKRKKKQIPKNFVVHTNDNLDVSGIQFLPDSPTLNTNEKSTTNIKSKPTIGISDLKCLPESRAADKKCINKLINVKCDPKLDVCGERNLSKSNPIEKSAKKIKFDPKGDMSGVDYLLSRPFLTSSDEDSDEELTIFEGVVAFADYRRNSKDYNSSVHWKLRRLGAKVEKTFTNKVTHVIFNQGYRRTYTTAIKRNVPLVSLLWLEYSRWTETLLDPAEYPPRNMEKYINPPQRKKYKNYQKENKLIYSFVTPEDFRRAEILETEHFKETDPLKDEHEQSKRLIDILSTKLHETLSVDDGNEVKPASTLALVLDQSQLEY